MKSNAQKNFRDAKECLAKINLYPAWEEDLEQKEDWRLDIYLFLHTLPSLLQTYIGK